MLCDALALQRSNRAFFCCPIAMQPSQLGAQRRSPYTSLTPIRLRERSSAHRFRSSGSLASADLIEQSVRAGPDALFDLFEFVFSPGLAVILGFVAVAFLWSSRDSNEEDSTVESRNTRLTQNDTDKSKMMRKIPKNLDPDSIYLEMRLRMAKQTAEEEERKGARFVIRFSGEKDAIYENPVNGIHNTQTKQTHTYTHTHPNTHTHTCITSPCYFCPGEKRQVFYRCSAS